MFMNETGNVFVMEYKNKDNKTLNRIFNVELASGDYALFVSLNGVTYNTNKVIEF